MRSRVPASRQQIAEFCRRHHIRRLSLFGSVLRDDFRPGSDIEDELAQLLGRRVDLVSEKYLNPRIRDSVLMAAEVQYAEG